MSLATAIPARKRTPAFPSLTSRENQERDVGAYKYRRIPESEGDSRRLEGTSSKVSPQNS